MGDRLGTPGAVGIFFFPPPPLSLCPPPHSQNQAPFLGMFPHFAPPPPHLFSFLVFLDILTDFFKMSFCVCVCVRAVLVQVSPSPPPTPQTPPHPIRFLFRVVSFICLRFCILLTATASVCVCVRACARMYDAVVCNLSKKVLPARVKVGGPQKGLLEASGGNNSPSQGQQHGGRARLLAARVLGDGLGALADGVLGQLAWQQEADGCLDFPSSSSCASCRRSERPWPCRPSWRPWS